jgi:GNAT superfamily N-acetyltransferase
MKTTITVSSPIERTVRVMQLEGLFDVPQEKKSELTWNVDLPIESLDWSVGLIVGPSGCLAGDTPIHDPVDGSTLTVQQRWVLGVDFHVTSSDKDGRPQIAVARAPHRYPESPIWLVRTSRGSIRVTPEHRFRLLDGSYITAFDVAQRLREAVAVHLLSTSDGDPIARDEGGQRLGLLAPGAKRNRERDTTPDRISDDRTCRGLDWNRSAISCCVLPAKYACFTTASRSGVHTCGKRQPSWRRSTPRIDRASRIREAVVPSSSPTQLGSCPADTASPLADGEHRSTVGASPVCSWSVVETIEPDGRERYFDFHVPGYENYFAAGSFHHNCGKSTVARKLFGEHMRADFAWPADKALVDGFPASLGVKDVVELLSAVGFSSPPSWMRPYHVLSTGQQFRVHIARLLAENQAISVVDEFTSVVDRTVAQIGSAAIAKTVRRRGQKFIAVSCHEDVAEWLDPDWVYRPAEQLFERRLLQGRPKIELEIYRVHHSMWRQFAPHHYLTAHLNHAATCFAAYWKGRPVAFDAWLPFFGALKDSRSARRGHRTVCLPDYQGVGIGNALFGYLASMWTGLGYRAFSCTGHPAEVNNRLRSKVWTMTRKPSHTGRDATAKGAHIRKSRSSSRLTASFEYSGPPLDKARALHTLNAWAK